MITPPAIENSEDVVVPASEAQSEVAIMPPAAGNSEVAQPAGGNEIAYDNDLEYLKLGRVVAEAQYEVCIRVKEIENLKPIGAASGNTKEVYYMNLCILIFV